jgi:hypothetical protein
MGAVSHSDLVVVVAVLAGVQLTAIIVVGALARRTLTQSRRDAVTLAKLIFQESLKIRRQGP